MTPGLEAAKAEARRLIRPRLAAMSPAQRTAASDSLCHWILRWDVWQAARTVLLYAPIPGEPDIGVLVEDARVQGKRICLPRYREADGSYEVAECAEGAGGVVVGRYGVREPGPASMAVPWIQLDLAMVPGVGFSPDGCRIGRGRGFFDRLLAPFRGLKCGVAFDEQIVDALPVGSHDVRLDCILTPTRRWIAGRRVVVE